MSLIRLDKFVSVALKLSRADTKRLLKDGKITVDGVCVKKGDFKVDTETACVKSGNENLEYKEFVYILMNKPSGILSASNDKRAKTVVDIVPPNLKREGLFPVGRLDKDTTGLLIITDDGDFAHKIISPKSNIEKVYLAHLDGDINDEMIEKFQKGVVLADGTKCMSAKLEKAGDCSALVTIREGKYHQVKRMFGTVGLGVNKLHRISIGRLSLPKGLEAGSSMELTAEDLNRI